jgi:translation initiation factor IF-2
LGVGDVKGSIRNLMSVSEGDACPDALTFVDTPGHAVFAEMREMVRFIIQFSIQ